MYRILIFLIILNSFIVGYSQPHGTVPSARITTVNIIIKDSSGKAVSTGFTLTSDKTNKKIKLKTDKRGVVSVQLQSGQNYSLSFKDRPNYDVVIAENTSSRMFNFKVEYMPKGENTETNPLAHLNLQPTYKNVLLHFKASEFIGDSAQVFSLDGGFNKKSIVRNDGNATMLIPKGKLLQMRIDGIVLKDSLLFATDRSIRSLEVKLDRKAIIKKNVTTPKPVSKEIVTDAYRSDEAPFDLNDLLGTPEENESWLVVVDVTGSMQSYLKAVAKWQQEFVMKSESSIDFVFFNDGDNKPDNEKELGKTGGVYFVHGSNLQATKSTMVQAIFNGNGGAEPENDVEAIIFGLTHADEYQRVILVADNNSSVRDIALLDQVTQPIEIILCGTTDIPHDDYQSMIEKTGGSILKY